MTQDRTVEASLGTQRLRRLRRRVDEMQKASRGQAIVTLVGLYGLGACVALLTRRIDQLESTRSSHAVRLSALERAADPEPEEELPTPWELAASIRRIETAVTKGAPDGPTS